MSPKLSLEQIQQASKYPNQQVIKLTKWFTVYGSHRIEGLGEGHPCATTHGHEWRIGITVSGPLNMDDGTVANTEQISKAFWSMMGDTDHVDWNDKIGFPHASGEMIGLFVYGQLMTSDIGPYLRGVAVQESSKLVIEIGKIG